MNARMGGERWIHRAAGVGIHDQISVVQGYVHMGGGEWKPGGSSGTSKRLPVGRGYMGCGGV